MRRKLTMANDGEMCIKSDYEFDPSGRWRPAIKYSVSTTDFVHFDYSYCFQLNISGSKIK